jgi:hypothetical protein
MQILKLLGPLEKLETRLSELYEWFSGIFKDDTEVSGFFQQMSFDEGVHADLVRFQRRIVSKNIALFGEVEADFSEIDIIMLRIEGIMKSSGTPTIDEAFDLSKTIEESVAEQHYIHAINQSNPDVTKLFNNLTSFDRRHFTAFEEFSKKRWGTVATAENSEEIQHNDAPGEEEMPVEELITAKRLVDIPQEFIDRIDYLFTWHKRMGFYKVLGVRPYASEHEIRRGYYQMAREFHPDMHMDFPDDLRQKINTIYIFLNAAYSILMDSKRRREYDSTLPSRGLSFTEDETASDR